MKSKNEELLVSLIDQRELASITFVRGYIQLNFDGPYLNVYQMPELGMDDSIINSGELGFYDNLCGLIGKKIVSAREFSNMYIMLNFDGGSFLRISLKVEGRVGAEVAMLQDGTGKKWTVW